MTPPAPPGLGGEEAVDASASGSGTASKGWRHWPWYRWLANLMILAGVLCLPGYFLGTCACTALHQQELRQELEAVSPGLMVEVAQIAEAEFVSVDTTTPTTLDPSATEEEISAAQAVLLAEELRRKSELALFKTAADQFASNVSGVMRTALGRIVIPSIDLDVVMLEGTSKGDLKEGPGHWEETPFPGQGGNFVVSGHRTTYGAPFFKLDDVEVGDEIQLIMPYVVARYKVVLNIIVYPDEVETVRSVGREQVSLAACHPLYSAKQRIVVIGDLVSFKLVE
ncbi:MAG: class E sortase [Thermoleophilia bacterium]|nr:class E sortase [Thermoleophilia bacterium]